MADLKPGKLLANHDEDSSDVIESCLSWQFRSRTFFVASLIFSAHFTDRFTWHVDYAGGACYSSDGCTVSFAIICCLLPRPSRLIV